jgi:hypothetical protein
LLGEGFAGNQPVVKGNNGILHNLVGFVAFAGD